MSTAGESYDEFQRRQGAAVDDEPGEDRRHRAGRPQLAVTFRHPDGSEDTFGYDHLYHLRLEGNTKLTVTFSDHVVEVSGRNLRLLARHLANHTIDLIEANPDNRDFARPGDTGPVVHRIVVSPRTG